MTLIQKLIQVYEEIDHIEKSGYNKHQNYAFVRAADMVRAVRKALLKLGVYAEVNMINERQYTIAREKAPNAPFAAVDVRCIITFHDSESGETITASGLGTGADTGDKATYKAQTGATKYAMRNAFLVPDEADPEADGKTDEGAAPDEPEFHNSRHAEPRANQTRPTQTAASFAPPAAYIPPANPVAELAKPNSTATASAPTQPASREPGDESESDVPPTEQELVAYREQFKKLGDLLSEPAPFGGNLKASKGLPINRKLVAFMLHITKAPDPKAITKAQWDNFFNRVDAAKVNPEVGMVGLAKLINKANGLEEKK